MARKCSVADEGPESLDVLKQISTFEQAIKLMEDVLPVSDQLAKLVALPKPQFDAQYPEFKRKTKSDNLLAGPLHQRSSLPRQDNRLIRFRNLSGLDVRREPCRTAL